ncbi:unnamed protein product (macronuclear) [Paramecium tetraurelia]|uniref:Uncharacterized protein n=1 Tax=Paramecium tetraurelia TaxID=5888 RepID=A0CG17_PARTE|nr:uncharacterized protein GSPATT00038177001 [Paramecium tetraurelia]CAK69734.1 unnamed protein product [Paramecium tetraurelia]|eukprot:XP_001437131.1 hypothetical protein (macronuclear) [Paramecium tetraurelia strain d4-2]
MKKVMFWKPIIQRIQMFQAKNAKFQKIVQAINARLQTISLLNKSNALDAKNPYQKQCIVKFHQQCFFKELNDQNTKKQVFLYKCKCGTKIPSTIIRKCGAPNFMEFLSSIHRRQLDLLMTQSNLRKNHEIVSFYMQNKLKEHELDFFIQEKDKLTYDETPQ